MLERGLPSKIGVVQNGLCSYSELRNELAEWDMEPGSQSESFLPKQRHDNTKPFSPRYLNIWNNRDKGSALLWAPRLFTGLSRNQNASCWHGVGTRCIRGTANSKHKPLNQARLAGSQLSAGVGINSGARKPCSSLQLTRLGLVESLHNVWPEPCADARNIMTAPLCLSPSLSLTAEHNPKFV